ncbi:hypothetical protein HNP99_002977 [Flavobacterium sp. 28A]|uniref:hypothetical protein n=1 Tax=Flavobacterium sp. 28A TaxID=2735895 RepID=UPI00156DD166|nr:hypothetical protein [Flavobacterium sp. 28A]NRT16606.1 hypothetical protein [Flavobacterium sp. 28A]
MTNNIRNSGGQNNMKSADNFFEIKVEKRDEVTCNVCDYLVKDPNNRRPRTKLSKYSIWNIFDWLLN